MSESAAAVTTPLIEELPDEDLPDADEESLLPFTVSEEPPRSQRESRYSRPIARRKPSPMPEALAAIHRKATAPAPVPSGRVARDRSPISGDPPDTPPLSDHGTPDLGSAT